MDARLRQLERRLRGGEIAPAALLRERLRAGQLTLRQLQLAAHLGHGAAREALGAEALPAPPDGPFGQAWVEGLAAFGATLPLRAVQAALGAALFPFAAARPGDLRPGKALEAVGLALEALEQDDPHTPLAELVAIVFAAAVEAGEAARDAGSGEAHWAAMAARLAAESAASQLGRRAQDGAWATLLPLLPRAWGALDAAVRALGEVSVRAAIGTALLPLELREPA